MTQAHMLTRHRDIQNWVNDRDGRPAIARVRDRFGDQRAQLKLRFSRCPEGTEDAGMSPCSWTAWLAELDRQQLALRIEPSGDCQIVARQIMN
ncbi:hypothetical protein SAMN06295905_3420 [Devosia lucknowensis]|uniref:Uncharacterized protein n=1 Tax=Devosia lucknowensis TaxID=1096929 RepID=A0A1Y6G7I6_9HYPH|nr:hypothetical protein [Devosia lucknowensis]SMQ86121.1 hypothetical protein SAMN06295905_3420 [Devosia lucknowensis]